MLNGVKISLAGIAVGLIVSAAAYGGIVDLNPDDDGDRVAVVKDGKVTYLPAKRADIGSGVVGGGSCRYIKRAANGDLYVTGPGLGLHQSTDGGHTWTTRGMDLGAAGRIGAFTILRDDTFVIAAMVGGYKEIRIARSTDYGKTWSISTMNGKLSPYNFIVMDNGDLLELADGRVLMTCNLRYRMGEPAADIEPYLNGAFPHVFHSLDGGKTWSAKSIITMYGAETHLEQLPSGVVFACIRKQRWHRLPGDPASILDLKKQHGWHTHIDNGFIDASEASNRIKNMFVSASYDGGYSWVNERQVSGFKQCSGEITYTTDGVLVLQYLHRYDGGPIADRSIRARVSYDDGKTWAPEEYILSDGENYPGSIAAADGGLISMCPHRGKVQAVHWKPLAEKMSG